MANDFLKAAQQTGSLEDFNVISLDYEARVRERVVLQIAIFEKFYMRSCTQGAECLK